MGRYDYVPLPDRISRDSREEAAHDRRRPDTLFGGVTVEYECRQPVHVGSGYKDLDGAQVIRRGVTRGDMPVVPGTTFKGVVRARYEAITRSCALFRPLPRGRGQIGRTQSRSQPDIKRVRADEAVDRKLDTLSDGCRVPREGRWSLCPACALFGCMGLRGRVAFTDLLPVNSAGFMVATLPEQHGPRLHHIGPAHVDRREHLFVVDALHGRKFARGAERAAGMSVQALPPGAKLRGELRLFNVTPQELGGLLCALGLSPASSLKVGAGKGNGLGRIEPRRAEWDIRDHLRREVDAAADDWRRKFLAWPDRHEAGELKLVSLHNERDL